MMDEKVLNKIKETLSKNMPKDGKAILFGSRARGDNRADSDWDILILLNSQDEDDRFLASYSLVMLGWKLNQDINPILYTKDEWQKNSFTPFYHNVTDEGIILYGT